jgi:Icc-related predicted phosphoesterase
MWSGANKNASSIINDFRYIRGFTLEVENEAHRRSVEWMNGVLSEKHDGPTVVVTHHLPLNECVSPKFIGNVINSGFVSNQTQLIEKGVNLWIYGHSHDFYMMTHGETKIVRNPFGYEFEKSNFFNNCVLEV